jgi:ATP-dependent helicase Lhr and Lhr-like helicase
VRAAASRPDAPATSDSGASLPAAADPLRAFSALTREWFTGAFTAPTPAQAGAWASISSGENTLVVAPTGSGKTLAAFLWALDRLSASPAPADPKLRTRVLYISPLKALAVDIERNLRAPLAGIRQVASKHGLPEPDIRVAVRTGDTAADERRRLSTKPPDILITTPESLFLVLTSKARDSLRGVDTVIVDEVHALAGNKRGAHLAVSLERLDALRGSGDEPDGAAAPGAPGPAQRIGLSATVRPAEEVAAFLGGSRPVTIAAPPHEKHIELRIVVPVEDMSDPDPPPASRSRPAVTTGGVGPPGVAEGPDEPPAQRSIWPHVEERVLDLIEAHRSTIVFANSRGLAERLCGRLNDLAADRALAREEERAAQAAAHGPPAQIMAQSGATSGAPAEVARAHHGSVSRQERAQIEEALKAGRLPAVVATSSLELGIDMGAVDLVIQVESAPSVASGLQRTGRAGHHVGDVSRSVIFPKYQGDLVQATVVAQRMRDGEIEELSIPRNPLDVLAQQIVAMVAMDDWQVADVERLIRRAAPFSGLTRGVLDAVLDMLAGRYPSEEFAELRPRLVWDRTSGTLRGRPGAQRLAVTSGGTIPDRGLFGVFLAGPQRQGKNSHRVGELDEEMVYESRVGDVFVLGASSWRIEDITADQVLVSPAPGQPGRLPFWHGDMQGRPAELGRALGRFCRELSAMATDEAATKLRNAGLDDLAAGNLIRYLEGQREATGYLPDDRTLVLERFRDELGDWRLVLHSPYGARVHAPWALAIAARLRDRYEGMDVQAMHTNDGIVLRVPDTDDPPSAAIVELAADEVESLVTSELGGSALFASRFRECAARALLLPRRRPGRRSPLWQQRQRSAQLLSVAAKYSTFPIVLETVRECLQDTFDVPALAGLMRDLAGRKIRLVEVETPAPSPFARSLLFSYVGAFMYEGDSPLAERRAQALALDSSLLAELLGQADLRELLDAGVVEETEAQLQRLAPDRRCRDLEAVADLLRLIGPLSAAEVTERCAEPARAAGWLAELDATRRAIEVRIGGEPRWAAVEDAGRLRDALGVPLPPGVPAAFAEPVPDPLGDLVARYGRCHGPFTAQAVAARYGLGQSVVSGALHRLGAERRVAEGEFLPGGRGTEWCDIEVLRLLRRRCLAKLRKEVEPAPPEALAAFLPAWQNAGQPADGARAGGAAGRPVRRSRAAGPDAVYDVVDQLAGAALPASALETLVLPGRIPGYQPAVLDELTSAGEVVWAGAGGLPSSDGWVVLAPAPAAALLLPPPVEITMTPVHEAVLAVLEGGGGLFFRMLADRVAGMLRDHDWRGLSDAAVAAAIWDLVWAGRLTNDTLAPLRTVLGSGRPVYEGAPPGPAAGQGTGAGPVPEAGPDPGAPELTNGRGVLGSDGASAPFPRGSEAPGFPGPGIAPPAGGLPGGGRRPGAGAERGGGNSRAWGREQQSGRPGRIGSRRSRYGRPSIPARTGPPTVTGRWSLLPERDPDSTRRLHAVAQALLDRHGIVTRGTVVAERVPGGFGAVYPVLRAMEEAGQCRRGYFVEGLGAAQFALPGAVDRMRAMAAVQASIPGLPPPPGAPEIRGGPPSPLGPQQDGPRATADLSGGPDVPGDPLAGTGPRGDLRGQLRTPEPPPSGTDFPAGIPAGPSTPGSLPDGPGFSDGSPGWPGPPGGPPGLAPDAAPGRPSTPANPPSGADFAGGAPGWPEASNGVPGWPGASSGAPGWPGAPDEPVSGYSPDARRGQRWPGAPEPITPAEPEPPPIIVLAAADPANPFGAALPWPPRPGEVPGGHRPGRKAGALVVMSGGHLILYVERGGKTLLSWTSDPAVLVPAAAGLAAAVRGGALGRLTVERADGTGVYDTPLAQALADAGFRPTPRGLRLRR